MELLLCLVCLAFGYLLGCVNPAAGLAKKKLVDLKAVGTKNLGATNATLILGRKCGVIVMVMDIAKAFLAARIAKWLLPKLAIAGLLAGCGAVLGHVYPFHLGFRGGKGLAAFGGLILAYDPVMFLILLALCVVLMLIVNSGSAVPMTASVLFPVAAGLHSQSLTVFAIAAQISALVAVKHWSNVLKALRGEDIKVRTFLAEKVFSSGS